MANETTGPEREEKAKESFCISNAAKQKAN